MTGVTGVIYTNINVTPCDKKCNFFILSTQRVIQQQQDLRSQYLGLNGCFYTLLFICILGLTILIQEKLSI